jgi:hypothetical protein
VSNDSFLAHSEPQVVVNPVDPDNLVAGSKFFTDPAHYRFKIGTYYSTDSGSTWTDAGMLPGFERYAQASDVSFAFSPNGSLVYASVLIDNGKQSGIFVSRSRDGGQTWLPPAQVFLDSSGSTFSDKPWIAVDGTEGSHRGTVYVAWNLDAAGKGRPGTRRATGIAVARSTNYGRTFSAPVIVSRFDRHHFAIGAIPAVGPDGRLHVAFLAMRDIKKGERYSLVLVTSADGGLTFSKPRTIEPHVHALPNHLPHGTFRNTSLPSFAVSSTTPSMVIVWADMRNGDADILERVSRDGGKTWLRPVRVNDDPVHNHKDQFQPALAVAPDGTYSCAWFDRRYDRGDRLIDEVIAQSTDDGRSFGKNLRVTKRSWDPAIGAPRPEGKAANTFIGDYQGLAADGTDLILFFSVAVSNDVSDIVAIRADG